MKFVFVLPPPAARPSGGHVFNLRMIGLAQEQGFPLEAAEVSPGGATPRPRGDTRVLWDSLLLDGLANYPADRIGVRHGLLVHYVPFLNPLLDAEHRKAETRRFDRAAQRAEFFIATGRSVRQLLERRYAGKPVFLSEPGVDAAFLAARRVSREPAENRPPGIVTVANCLPAKGLIELLEILSELRHYDWTWHLAGDERIDPGYTQRFRSRIADLGLQIRITLHGVLDTPELARLLAAMDIFAFASRFEAYGMALAEAAAVGLPVVTTDVGEASRIVRHGETGLVAPAADRRGFRENLERLLSDRELRRRYRARLWLDRPRSWQDAFADFRNAFELVAPGP